MLGLFRKGRLGFLLGRAGDIREEIVEQTRLGELRADKAYSYDATQKGITLKRQLQKNRTKNGTLP